MLHPTHKSCIPTDLDITPTLHYYDFEESSIIPVEVSNVTMQTVSVPPKGLLCEMQPVSITETVKAEPTSPLECILDKARNKNVKNLLQDTKTFSQQVLLTLVVQTKYTIV